MLVLLAALASSAPVQLEQTGRLVDTGGTPVEGAVDLTVALFPALSGGTAVFSETFADLPVQQGVYSATLGAGDDLDNSVFSATLYVELSVDGAVLGERQLLHRVPSAAHALVADAVVGVGITADGSGVHRFADGSVATTCFRYFRPLPGFAYVGAVGTGIYTIDPDGPGVVEPFDVLCDMGTDGGGWTVVKHSANDDLLADANRELPTELAHTLSYELSTAQIAAIVAASTETRQAASRRCQDSLVNIDHAGPVNTSASYTAFTGLIDTTKVPSYRRYWGGYCPCDENDSVLRFAQTVFRNESFLPIHQIYGGDSSASSEAGRWAFGAFMAR